MGRLRDLFVRVRARLRRPARRQAGIALILATVAVAMLTALVAELSYSTNIEMRMASNAENELRAHYFAESAVQLGQAAVLIQQMIDRFGSQFGMANMIQVDDLIQLLLPMFNQREGGGMLGSLLGVDPSSIKGLGVEGGSFDLKVGFEDGKLNLNCAGGLDQVTDTPQKKALGLVLMGMFSAVRYKSLFERMDSEGQYITPMQLASAMIDWVDVDEMMFMTAGAEDYRYDARKDKYLARNYFADTPDELRQVRGMNDDMWASFGPYLTAYGPCRINLAAVNPDHWPLVEGIIRAFAAPDDPNGRDERKLEALAQFVTPMLPYLGQGGAPTGQTGGSSSGQPAAGTQGGADGFVQLVQNPTQGMGMTGQAQDGTQMQIEGVRLQSTEPVTGATLGSVIGSGRKVAFRLEATGESGPGCLDPKRGTCTRKKITAIWDATKMGMNSLQAQQGLWVYWREE
jgi:general secretion pathway protein K